MKLFAPEYYPAFQCIAGDCRHSCCIGWEIDIDPQSLNRFLQTPGSLGERLRQNISVDGETACFCLQGEEERCPFLNETGLCDLILEMGEDALCQICTDHPRFRSFYADRTEIGLGLCCEAAGRLLLGEQRPMKLTVVEDDGVDAPADPEERELLSLREALFEMLQDRSVPVAQRMEKLLPAEWISWPEWSAFLMQLERLDERWTQLLELLARPCEAAVPGWMEVPMEQLMCYLLYRHLPGALEDGDTEGRIRFCGLMGQLVARLSVLTGCATLDDLVEIARLYSSEIEYSDENTCAILDRIAQQYEGR